MSKRSRGILAAVMLLVMVIPYAVAFERSGAGFAYTGILFNPLDGNSYLAKMYQGWSGSWRFVLPYSAEPGQGAYLFLYYLFLGHAAKWTGLSIVMMYHLARIVGTILLVFAIADFFTRVFADQPRAARLAAALASLGLGLGWIASLAGGFTSDLWVAEAFPFLAMYTNPHFPLGIALMLWIFSGILQEDRWKTSTRLAVLGLFLSIVMPFGIVIVAVIGGAKFLWDTLETRKIHLLNQIGWAVGGVPFLAYQYWATLRDPVLSGWNAQNVTPSPALWDLVISLSPALIFGLIALSPAWKKRNEPGARLLLLWFILGLALIYVPFNLQRRFMSAIYVPVAGMAVLGSQALRQKLPAARKLWLPVLALLSIPTNLIILAAGIFGANAVDPQAGYPVLYLSEPERAGMQWIRTNTAPRALILSGPETGLFIPAQTGRRVVYGHPYETINAQAELGDVTAFYSGEMDERQGLEFLANHGVDFVFYGPREQKLGRPSSLNDLPVVYEANGLVIYGRPGSP